MNGRPATNKPLLVVLGTEICPPSDTLELLVAFHFGGSPAKERHPALAETWLKPVVQNNLYECWWVADPVRYSEVDGVRVAECANYAVAILNNDEQSGESLETMTRRAYLDLIAALRTTPHKRIAKIWNYIGGINDGEGNRERYRRFSAGRAAAFDELKVSNKLAPAGTGVGTSRMSGLTVIAIASNYPIELTENPRQLSAFKYPTQYGPKSPKFARGGTVAGFDHKLILLSGTAAIVGHESVHPCDIEAQFEETLRNITVLGKNLPVLGNQTIFRVYLRDPRDVERVATKLKAESGLQDDQVAYLQGDICRRELLIEIEGVRVG
jgi:chorismate lyase/3-hydroxybenzoate synthase